MNIIDDITTVSNNNQQKMIGSAFQLSQPCASGAEIVEGQTLISCPPQVVSCSVDTIEITGKVKLCGDLLCRLKKTKEEVQRTTELSTHFKFGVANCFSFSLSRVGTKLYPYVLNTGDITLLISNRSCESRIPNVSIRIGSLSCQQSYTEVVRKIKMWFKFYNCHFIEEKVSRVDLAADLNIPISILPIMTQDYQITRATSYAIYQKHRKTTGVMVGRSATVLRIYDKIQEMTTKGEGHKIEYFTQKWNNPDHVTRFEFQLRREIIKEFLPDNSTVETLTKKIPEIWKYLTEEWFRLTEEPVDRKNKNQQRSKDHSIWSIVKSAFGDVKEAAQRLTKVKHISIKDLIRQASGVMLTVCSAFGHDHEDIFGIMSTIVNCIQKDVGHQMKSSSFESEFYKRNANAMVTF